MKNRPLSCHRCYTVIAVLTLSLLCLSEARAATPELDDELVHRPGGALQSSRPLAEHHPTRFIVKFKSTGPDALTISASSLLLSGTEVRTSMSPSEKALSELHQQHRIKNYRPLSAGTATQPPKQAKVGFERRLATLHQKHPHTQRGTKEPPDLSQIYIAEVKKGADVTKAVADLQQHPAVEYAHLDDSVQAVYIPDDTYYTNGRLWALLPDKLDMDPAWDLTEGDSVIVAVNDTGTDIHHEDLAANIWRHPDEQVGDANGDNCPGECGVDDDGDGLIDEDSADLQPGEPGYSNDLKDDDDENGYVDDVWGWDFVSGDHDPSDGNGHGTHVAGTVAAVGNNGLGAIGVAPKAKILTTRGLDDEGRGFISDLAAGIQYAVNQGARVINNSWICSSCTSNPVVEDAVRYATSQNVLVVFAAGNDSSDVAQSSPQNMVETVTVSASDANDQLAFFSNFGPLVDVAAPGVDIVSLNARGGDNTLAQENPGLVVDVDYLSLSGTSMAAPHVVGLASLILSKNPGLNIEEVRSILRASAEDILEPGFDESSGHGRIQASAAVLLDAPCSSILTSPPSALIFESPEPATSISIEGSAECRFSAGSFVLEVGHGESPTTWDLITSGLANHTAGPLADWLLPESAGSDGRYTFRLTVTDGAGRDYTDCKHVDLFHRYHEVTYPLHNDILRRGEVFAITGRVTGPDFESFSLDWGFGFDPQTWSDEGITLAQDGTQPIVGGLLGHWDTSALSARGFYTLRLQAVNQGITTDTYVHSVHLDDRLRVDWPQYLGMISVQPMVVDIDDDGLQEVLITGFEMPDNGQSRPLLHVYSPDGALKGSHFVGEGRPGETVHQVVRMAVGNIDLDRAREIVVPLSYFESDLTEIYVLNYDGIDWVDSLLATLPHGGYRLAIADLDRDGVQELIARGGHHTGGSHLFVLDHQGTIRTELQLPPFQLEAGELTHPGLAIGDFDLDPDQEIVTHSGDDAVVVFNADGSVVDGWPISLNTKLLGQFSVGDVDGNGEQEIVVSGYQASAGQETGLHVFRRDGTLLPGWPAGDTAYIGSPALYDFDGDGKLEIVATRFLLSRSSDPGGLVHVFDHQGNFLAPWPGVGGRPSLGVNPNFRSSVLADVDGDGAIDILHGDGGFHRAYYDGRPDSLGGLLAHSVDGNVIDLSPEPGSYALLSEFEPSFATPVVADLDGNGLLDLVTTSNFNSTYCPPWDLSCKEESKNRQSLYVYELNVPFHGSPWPMLLHDPEQTGCLDCSPTRCDGCLSCQTPGEQRCFLDAVEVCQADASGALVWTVENACYEIGNPGEPHWVCSDHLNNFQCVPRAQTCSDSTSLPGSPTTTSDRYEVMNDWSAPPELTVGIASIDCCDRSTECAYENSCRPLGFLAIQDTVFGRPDESMVCGASGAHQQAALYHCRRPYFNQTFTGDTGTTPYCCIEDGNGDDVGVFNSNPLACSACPSTATRNFFRAASWDTAPEMLFPGVSPHCCDTASQCAGVGVCLDLGFIQDGLTCAKVDEQVAAIYECTAEHFGETFPGNTGNQSLACLDDGDVDAFGVFIPVANFEIGSMVGSDLEGQWREVSLTEGFVAPPVLITAMQGVTGGNPAGLRVRNLSSSNFEALVEEETSADSEVNHSEEVKGYLAFDGPGVILDAQGVVIGEVASLSHAQADGDDWATLEFQRSYTDPVAILNLVTFNDPEPAHVRIRNVSSTSLEFQIEEWDYLDQAHPAERIDCVILETGIFDLPDGRTLEVGQADVALSFLRQTFDASFDRQPLVFSQAQTDFGPSAIVTRQRNLDATGFELRIQEEEAGDGIHSAERVGYLALGTAGCVVSSGFECQPVGFHLPGPGSEVELKITNRNSTPATLRQADIQYRLEDPGAKDGCGKYSTTPGGSPRRRIVVEPDASVYMSCNSGTNASILFPQEGVSEIVDFTFDVFVDGAAQRAEGQMRAIVDP